MSDLRTVAQQALEALEWHLEKGAWGADIEGVTAALRERLAQPEQEPVAWMDIDENGNRLTVRQWSDGNREEVPLYTAPPQRKPLSHGEFLDIWQKAYEPGHRDFVIAERVARAVEQAHGIKENT